MIRKLLISRKTILLFLGVALSAFLSLQVIHAESHKGDVQEQTDPKDDKTGSETTISLSQTIPNSASQINLGFDSYLLDEVTFSINNNEKPAVSELIKPRVHKAIRILLRKIVTPNAP